MADQPINAGATPVPTGPVSAAPTNQSTGGNAVIPQAPASTPLPTTPSPTINASQLGNTSSNVQFPSNTPSTASTASLASSLNTSIPSTTPSIQDITSQETQQTPAEQTNNSLLTQVANFLRGRQSLATQQYNAEGAAGVPSLTKTVNDLNTQLQGLNDQASALQIAGGAGGSIENAMQNNAEGRGITAGGLAPLTAAELRKNQIQQASISTQSLTVKSALYAAQGNLTLAKDAADKAAQVAFDTDQQQLDYMNALIDANKPQMTKEEQAQADTVKAQLTDRQNQINLQQENFKTGQAAIADALKNNPNDPNAQSAAQQATQLDPKDPQYLQKVTGLVGKYGTDLTQRALDIQAKQTQTALQNEQLKNLRNAGINLSAANLKTAVDGTKYIDGTNLSGTDQAQVQRYAAANNIPYVGKDSSDTLIDISNAQLNQTDIINQIQGLLPKDSAGHIVSKATVPLSQLFQSNDQKAAFNSWRTAAINSLRATAGSKGLRINQAEIYAATENDIPQLTDTLGTAEQKFKNVQTLLQNAQNSILVPNKQGLINATEPVDRSKGARWIRPDGTYVSDGNQWVKQ